MDVRSVIRVETRQARRSHRALTSSANAARSVGDAQRARALPASGLGANGCAGQMTVGPGTIGPPSGLAVAAWPSRAPDGYSGSVTLECRAEAGRGLPLSCSSRPDSGFPYERYQRCSLTVFFAVLKVKVCERIVVDRPLARVCVIRSLTFSLCR